MKFHRDLVVVMLVLAGCASPGTVDDSECPETVAEDGLLDGIDLDAPGWLPTDLPLPEGWSIRHVNSQTDAFSSTRVLTGFLPNGGAASIVDSLRARFEEADYEILLAADGFVPVGNVAFVALDEEPGLVVMVDATTAELPARADDGTCPWVEGILVGIRLDEVDPAVAKASYVGSYLTTGSASATIGGQEFAGAGECFVHDGTFRFSATQGAGIAIEVSEFEGEVIGFGSVDVEEVAVFSLDVTPVSGVDPVLGFTDDGFFVEGMFVDAFGDLGIVAGRIDANCSP
jgi:hypothetical protein